jgi:Leucine-rich repeat (LRR) protein
MRTIGMSILALTICSVNLVGCRKNADPTPSDSAATDPKPAETTEEQLASAKVAYAKHGATYRFETDSQIKRNYNAKQDYHVFTLLNITDADLKGLPDMPFGLTLGSIRVTDAGLKEIKELKNLTYLDLDAPAVTDAGLKELKDLKSLTYLKLRCLRVTDAGLKEIKELKNLTTLDLSHMRTTDAGLKEIKELKNLISLDLWISKVTDAGMKDLKELTNLT